MYCKYPSLTNLHNIPDGVLDLNQDVAVTEKIDGSNFSVVVSDHETRIASRNQLVSNDWHNIDQLIDWGAISQIHARFKNKDFNLYGEVFSSKILKRIPYGETQIAFYACMIDGEMMTTDNFLRMAEEHRLKIIPHTVMKLRDAIAIDVESLDSLYANGYGAEGIVIKAMHTPSLHPKIYAIKNKASRFLEKAHAPKELKDAPSYVTDFIQYLNENRVLSYISKVGEPVDKSQIAEYITGIGQDAIQEYLSTLSEEEKMLIDLRQLKKPVGKIIAPFIVKRIALNTL